MKKCALFSKSDSIIVVCVSLIYMLAKFFEKLFFK